MCQCQLLVGAARLEGCTALVLDNGSRGTGVLAGSIDWCVASRWRCHSDDHDFDRGYGSGVSGALGQLFASGVGVALSPIPVIAVILMLTTPRGRVTGFAFMTGWLAGLAAATGIVLLLANGANQAGSTSADAAHWATLLVGLLFLALAVRQWRARPKGDTKADLPPWMAGIDSFGVPKCFALGALLSGVNPKNLAMAVSAGVALAETGGSTGQLVLGALIFIVIGSLSVAGPVLGSLVVPARTTPVLAEAKSWLVDHNSAIMFVLFAVLGASKTGEGLASLLH